MFNTWFEGKLRGRHWDNKNAASALEVDVSTIGRWIDGSSVPERKQIARICKVFQASPLMILRWTDPEILLEEISAVERQDNTIDILAQVTEVAEAIEALQRMPPKRRAAMLLLLRGSEE
jgi:plasmid maintenance system antidote protein VapI